MAYDITPEGYCNFLATALNDCLEGERYTCKFSSENWTAHC
jgi:hypothetical protein